jgi:hypothetical protein
MMNNDIQLVLNGLLADWHNWSHHTSDRAGPAGKSAVFGQSRSNSQYDWENGLESDAIDRRIMQGFDAAVQRLEQPWHTAICFEARNLAVRYQVWTSPRLPVNREEREILILEARNKLLKELARDGVLC